MKTIEERANERFPDARNLYELKCIDACISIAKEQRQIDIEDACEWLERNEVVKDIILCTGERLVDAFRKAMEE